MLELARTGTLGPVAHGMTHQELRDVLGPPVGWDAERSRDRARIWCYGDVELHFNNWVVWLIFSDHENLTDGGPTLHIDPWIIRRGSPCAALQQACRDTEIEFSVTTPDYDPCQRLLKTGAGVVFSFMDEPADEERPGLRAWWSTPSRGQ